MSQISVKANKKISEELVFKSKNSKLIMDSSAMMKPKLKTTNIVLKNPLNVKKGKETPIE